MQADKFFTEAQKLIGSADLGDADATFQFEITNGDATTVWVIDVPNKKIIKGGIAEPACVFGMSDESFVKLLTREAEPAELFMTGKLKLDGDMATALKFQAVLEGMDSANVNPEEILKSKL